MGSRRDPIERSDTDSRDLYDVATWEPRSLLDRIATSIFSLLYYGVHWIVILTALGITLALLATPAVLVVREPILSVFFGLSVVPALLLAAYIWYADITTQEPLRLLVSTFLLAVLFATFAAVVNTFTSARLQAIPLIGTVLFYYLIVGPVEETVKLLAVRVYAFRSKRFDAVIDGAVYGAVAGLGFAAIENAIYIGSTVTEVGLDAGVFTAATGIATVRALVGPGHVIYSAIAGYYLGLAKFNPQHAGPLIVKGLLVAAFVHATYNLTVGIVPALFATIYPVTLEIAFVLYVIFYNAAIGYYLYRKLSRYRRTYQAVRVPTEEDAHESELTEFDSANR